MTRPAFRFMRPAIALLLGTAVLMAALIVAPPARAAGIVVNSAADTVADDGVCTLREAITAANTDAASGVTAGECAAGSGADAITFAADYTITLGSTLPTVTTVMTITGNGAANTIIQASTCDPVTLPGGCTPADYRVFVVDGSNTDLTLDKVTVRHGNPDDNGGGIYSSTAAKLTVSNSTIAGNKSTGSGGGIYSLFANPTVINSTIVGNQANRGGGIFYRGGVVTVTGSTISGNQAGNNGGGFCSEFGDMTVTNSTISGNQSGASGGGFYHDSSTVTLTNTTVTGNNAAGGGGYYVLGGTLNLVRSLVSGNSASGVVEIVKDGAFVNANAYNVFGYSGLTNAGAFDNFTPGATDVNATSDGTTPTALAGILDTTLANNGGPTQTHALVAGSPAIDRGPSAACTNAPVNGVDQRGEPRNVNVPGTGSDTTDLCDSGAYEFSLPAPAGVCPADKKSTTTTRIVGIGMFPNAAATVSVPKPDQATNLYIQLAGKKLAKGSYTAARFKVFRNTSVLASITDTTLESKEYRSDAIFWYGTNLSAYDRRATKVNGELLVSANSVKNMPRALILYANYPTINGADYWNYVARLNKSDRNHVYWGTGWIATQTHMVTLPAALTDARPITVQAALVDNDPDKRPVWLTIQLLDSSNKVLVTWQRKPLGPTNGSMLNIFQPVLDAPVGTAKVRITLSSPNQTGDSVAIVGWAVNYPCEVDVR